MANLEEHVSDPGFRPDLLNLTTEASAYNIDEAAALVTYRLLLHLDQPSRPPG